MTTEFVFGCGTYFDLLLQLKFKEKEVLEVQIENTVDRMSLMLNDTLLRREREQKQKNQTCDRSLSFGILTP